VEWLPSKHEILSQTPVLPKKKKNPLLKEPVSEAGDVSSSPALTTFPQLCSEAELSGQGLTGSLGDISCIPYSLVGKMPKPRLKALQVTDAMVPSLLYFLLSVLLSSPSTKETRTISRWEYPRVRLLERVLSSWTYALICGPIIFTYPLVPK
jgi:hypothetical protein